MIDLATLPARTRTFLEHGAPEGQRQKSAFDAACQCRDAGATEAEARELVEAGATQCGLPLREAREAVRSAFKKPARKPMTKRSGDRNTRLSRPASPPVSAAKAADTNTPAAAETPTKRRVVARYDYTNAAGVLLYQVERTEPKGFRQRRPDGQGGWIYNLEGVPRTLYRLPMLATAGEIWIAEGEKDCDTLAGLGFVATCNSGGAGNWPHDHEAHFTGKRVIIIPDADPKGQEHAEAVARALHGVAASVKIVKLT